MRLVDADYIKESVKRQCDNCRKEGMKWMADSVERAIIEELDNTPTAQPERQVELDGTESNIEILSELRAQFNCFDEVEEPCYRALSDAICALSAQPERKKGKWLDGKGNVKIVGYGAYCSCCKRESEYVTNYCPTCGADMRTEGNDDD